MLAEVVTSEYLMRRALREAKFSEHAINAAMLKLFPEPGEDACEVVELLDPEADEPERWMSWVDDSRWGIGPDPNDADHFQPSPEDLAALDGICEEIERRIEFIQAIEQDEAREREQIRSRRILPDECFEPRILAGAVD
jgi:hypothetical protein